MYSNQICKKITKCVTGNRNKFYSNQIERCQGDNAMEIEWLAGSREMWKKVKLYNGDIVVEPARGA